jgi:hypothetical protein
VLFCVFLRVRGGSKPNGSIERFVPKNQTKEPHNKGYRIGARFIDNHIANKAANEEAVSENTVAQTEMPDRPKDAD